MNCLPVASNSSDFRIHALIEGVFKFTVDKDHVSGTRLQPLVYLKETAGVSGKPWMDVDVLEYALAERLLLRDCIPHILNISEKFNSRVTLNECITYLFECYKVLILYQSKVNNKDQDFTKAIDQIINLIIRYSAIAIIRPNSFESQDIRSQFINVFSKNNITHLDVLVQFFQLVAAEIRGGNNSFDSVCLLVEPVLRILLRQIESGSIHNLPLASLDTLKAFVKIPEFAFMVVKTSWFLFDEPEGERYTMSILGTLFSMPSMLLKYSAMSEVYPDENSIYGDIEFMGQQFWPNLKVLSVHLHRILLSFLEASSNVRKVSLRRIHKCIKEDEEYFITQGDEFTWNGFGLNLCSVLLRFCVPFTNSTNLPKLLTINPTYVFLKDIADDRKIREILDFVPHEEGYSFNTDCFFMAHCAVEQSLGRCIDWLTNLQQGINKNQRISKNYQEDVRLPTRMYNTLATILFEPSFIDNLNDFYRATCAWLVQLFFNSSQSHKQYPFVPLQYRNLNIALLPSPPDTFKRVPEFLFENLHSYLMLLSRHHPISLERLDFNFLEPVFTALIIYKSWNRLVHNTKCSCYTLAECIMCLLPTPTRMDSLKMDVELVPTHFSNKLLNTHPYRREIIPSLLDAFSCFHMTNHRNTYISFRERFDFCHQMYDVMNYLWTLENQKQVFIQLAIEAEQNMEAVNPPLFLHFINILMENASYYLLEVLLCMAQLEKMQPAWVNEEMESISKDQIELLKKLDKEEQLAISFNILCMDTITMLEYLTEDIKTIFCHNSVVNRIADVLNDYLIHLVGPKKENFAIKNIDQYKFKPATIVRRICAVYINLGCDGRFRMAVDRHEYASCSTSQLLYQAADVLTQSKSLESGSDLDKFIWRIGELAKQIEDMLGMLSKAPVDFIDVITSTLMIEPVILPSSRQVVDRSTIERCLSENQTDPFTRLPLTINMVQPDVKLKQKIEEWIKNN